MPEPQTVELAELVAFTSGGTPSRTNAAFWGGNIPWVSGKDMKSFKIRDSIEHVTPAAVAKGTRVVGQGSILILVRGMALFKGVPIGLLACEASFNQDVKALIPKHGVDPTFLAYSIAAQEHNLRSYVSTAGHGTGRLITEALETLPIWLPPYNVQRQISALLDAWDEAIISGEKLVAAKETRLDWVRANVLTGKARLPGCEKPWKSVPIAKVLTEHGQTSTGAEEVHSVSVHQGLINQIEHLGRSFAAANTDHYNRVLPGDIVYTKSPTGNFPLGIIKQSRLNKAAIVSPLYGVFSPASCELGTIMDTLFASPAAAERLLAPVVQKGAKNTIAVTNKNFLKAQLHLPTDQREIVALSELVEAARAELDVHRAELKLLRNQKRGLMQKLLTGQWRVPESIDALLPAASEVAA
jgi:type I restriction enzyme S subunit